MTRRRPHRGENPHGIDLYCETWYAVYLHKGARGRVLYVGCTNALLTRNNAHRSQAPWRSHIVKVEVDSLWPDRAAGLDRERELIAKHRPPGNRQHNPSAHSGESAFEGIVRILGSRDAATTAVLTRPALDVYVELVYGRIA